MSIANDDMELSQDEIWIGLAKKSQSGDKRAYNRLLTELVPYIKMRISGSLANPDWVEEIAQEVLISVHKSLNSYSADRPLKPWLNAIIQFRRTDFLRKHYKHRNVKEKSQENAAIYNENVTSNSHIGELKDIESAMASLPEKQQTIFRLMKIEGYSAIEVAKKMDMSVSAVKVSAHRTAGKLKDMLG
tara:strand:+ start:1402 stop:1965 length:564 start_codon:yes stop_codon:yes gene_type:complete